AGTIEVHAEARSNPHELTLAVKAARAKPVRLLFSHHVALNGDDGSTAGPASWRRNGEAVVVAAAAETEIARPFPKGSFQVEPLAGTTFERVAGDELLFADGRSREQPYICIVTAPAAAAGLRISGHLLPEDETEALRVDNIAALAPQLKMTAPAAGPLSQH